jgi:flagellar M-ring protein FliF
VNFDQIVAHLKKLFSTLSGKQLVGLGAVFIAVVAVVVASAYWISTPQYTLLMADMDAESANAVVSKLKDAKVDYRLGDGGRTVSVPVEHVDELRMQFASGGLPSAGRIGFEIFDRTAFGTTEFLEHVNYRRALEGELARTISTLSEVSSARVHIAMAKDSLFINQSEAAKASVVLRLKSNRPLLPATIHGIASLVAGSVESLRPESVVILDNYGRSLTKPSEETEAETASGLQIDRQQQLERDMSSRVLAMLEPVVGAGRVRVNVAAYLKPDQVEETEEVWDPSSVVRSRQTTTETSTGYGAGGGVAGARANQPAALSTATTTPAGGAATSATQPNPAAPTGAAANAATATPTAAAAAPVMTPVAMPSGSSRTSETTNYEVSRTTRHTTSPRGQLARLSVAVILDDERTTAAAAGGTAPQVTTKPWDQAGIQRIHGLVAAAVGFDKDRGDQITVENIAFDAPQDAPPAAAPTMVQELTQSLKQQWPMLLRGGAILLVAVLALFGVLRPLARRAGTLSTTPALPAPAANAARLPTVQEMEGQIDAELDAAAAGHNRRLPVLTQRVAKLANDEPEQLARIVRGWISEGRR